MIRTWTLSNEGVRALPSKVWHGAATAPAPTGPKGLALVKSGPAESAPVSAEAELTDNQRAVLKVVRDGATTNAEISKATGLNPGSSARAVDALVKRGLLAKDGTAISLGGAA
jgi:Winged helix-turn-helix DNA-binding